MLELPGQTVPDWALTVTDSLGGGCGIIDNLPEEVYHGTRALLGKSSLMIAAERSGLHFKHWLDTQHVETRDPDDIIKGKAFHTMCLEPDFFGRRFIIEPDWGSLHSSITRGHRKDWLRDEAKGRLPLKESWMPMLHGMAAAVRHHPKLAKLILKGMAEVTALWVDPATGIPLKSRGDFVSDFTGAFVDLKSAIDASREGMRRAATRFKYFVQDPLYSRAFHENGIHVRNFVFAAVEKEPPYAVGLYQLDDGARLAGEQVYMASLQRVARWCNAGEFPGYNDDKIVELRISPFMLDEAEQMAEQESNLQRSTL